MRFGLLWGLVTIGLIHHRSAKNMIGLAMVTGRVWMGLANQERRLVVLESTHYNLNRPGCSVSFSVCSLKASHAGRSGHITGGDRRPGIVSGFQEAGPKDAVTSNEP